MLNLFNTLALGIPAKVKSEYFANRILFQGLPQIQ